MTELTFTLFYFTEDLLSNFSIITFITSLNLKTFIFGPLGNSEFIIAFVCSTALEVKKRPSFMVILELAFAYKAEL